MADGVYGSQGQEHLALQKPKVRGQDKALLRVRRYLSVAREYLDAQVSLLRCRLSNSAAQLGLTMINARYVRGLWMMASVLTVGASLAQATEVLPSAQASSPKDVFAGNPEHGKVLYQSCTSCHSIDENDIGPKHRGVLGRKAGTVPDYAYSAALKNSGIVWDKSTLDRWLTNPSAMVPGTKMFFLIADPKARADVIAYLAELK